ncbi:MAG: MFS transporter [Planctomycetes bacterium]|nr:MFS transporter [Planctomycetota bacterium]
MSLPVVERRAPAAGRWGIVVLLMAFAALGHFNRVGISVAGSEVFIPKYGLRDTQMGWVYTAFLIVYTIGMLPGGWLIDRVGSRRALTIYGVTMGAFVALTGALGWLGLEAQSLWLGLLVVRSCAGLCNAPLHPSMAHVVSDTMAPAGRATANGLVTAGALIGIAFSYPGYGSLIDRLHWPLAFVVGGGALAAFAVIWSLSTRSWSGDSHAVATPTAVETERSSNTDASASAISAPGDIWAVIGNVNLWLLSLSYAAYGYFQYLFFYWMDYYFKTVLHVPDVDSRWASFWIMLAMGAGMAVGGICTDLVCRRLGQGGGRRTVVVVGMALGALFGFLGVHATDYVQVASFLAASMAAVGMCEGVFWTTATDLGRKSRGFSAAFMNVGGNVGGLLSPILTPVLARQLGWSGAIAVACGIAGLGGAIWFVIRVPQPSET